MRQRIKKFIINVPGAKRFLESNVWKLFRYKLNQRFGDRRNTTFTSFLRLHSQYEALSGPVLDFLLADDPDKTLKITVLGCSDGSEPYSIASILKNRHPKLEFKIYAYDIYKEIIYKAKSATYEREEIFCNPRTTVDFVNTTFDIENNSYKIKKEIAEHVVFGIADALLDVNLRGDIGTSDIVYAQNFLIHMKPKMARKAFNNICLLLNPKAALFIDGIDLDVRQKLTRINSLMPLDYKIIEIHNEAYNERSYGWPLYYWGIEPLLTYKTDWKQRYSTIFLKNNSTSR